MRIVIRMNSIANMLINEEVLGYIPSAIDPNRVLDSTFNLQIHFPRKYSREEIEECAGILKEVGFRDFNSKSVTIVRHKPCDKSFFHHISTKDTAGKSGKEVALTAVLYIIHNLKKL